MWKYKRSQIAKAILRKKNGTGGIRLPDFILYYKAIVMKTVWYWHKNRNIDQWNKIESREINPCAYGHLIFDKEGMNIQWRKESLFNKWCWENWTTIHKTFPHTVFKNKLKMVQRPKMETIKLLEENTGRILFDINHSNILLNWPPKVKEIKLTNGT